MQYDDSAVAVFADHAQADSAVRKLAAAGFRMEQLSVIGKGYHTEEKAIGFYNMGERVKFWGSRGVVWGGLWGLFFGGLFMTIPLVGHVIVLGYLAVAAMSAVEGAVVVGGVSAIAAALSSIGIPKDSVVTYETAIKADDFVVMAHGTAPEMSRAKAILADSHPKSLDMHSLGSVAGVIHQPIHVGA